MVVVTIINIRLSYKPDLTVGNGDTIDYDLLGELRALRDAQHQYADVEMQKLYPEGYIFMNAIYALAWSDFIESLSRKSMYYHEGIYEITKACNRINTELGRSTFQEFEPANFGCFYSGWNNYVLGRKLMLLDTASRDSADVIRFQKQSEMIADTFRKSVYPESYVGASWPADAIVAIASLSLHDRMFSPRYTRVIRDWLKNARLQCDDHGLIAHAAMPDGTLTESARGSSQSLILIFLHDIDSQFADQQFKDYRSHFIDERFGLTGIREYPKGISREGDIDSGPIVLQFGFAATLTGMHTLYLYGDLYAATAIRNQIEAFGFPTKGPADKKSYLFGKLPIADAFIAWGHAADNPKNKHNPNFLEFHLWSLLVGLLIVVCLWLLWRKRLMRDE